MDKYEKLLGRQRDRSIATLLDFKERECDGFLPHETSRLLRKVILDQLNDLTVFCIDLLSAMDEGTVVLNDVYLQRIDEIHERLTAEDAF